MRIRHIGEKSLQALVKEGLLKGDKTCKLNFCEHYVIGKKTKVKFDTAFIAPREFLTMFTEIFGETTSIRGNHYYVSFIDDFSKRF